MDSESPAPNASTTANSVGQIRVFELARKLGPPWSYCGIFIEELLRRAGWVSTIYLLAGVIIGLLGSGVLLWKGYYPMRGWLFVSPGDYQSVVAQNSDLSQRNAVLDKRLKNGLAAGSGSADITPLEPNGGVIIDYKGRVTFSWNDVDKERADYSIRVQSLCDGDGHKAVEFPYSKQGGDPSWTVNLFENELTCGRYVWSIRPSHSDSEAGIYRAFSVYPGVLQKVATLRTLVVGTSLTPDKLFFEVKTDGKAGGFEPQLVDLLVQRLQPSVGNVEIRVKYLKWDDLLPSLARHDLDLVISSMTRTRARETIEGVKFSRGYFTTHQRFVVRAGMTGCLASLTIGVVAGEPKTTNEIAAELLTKRFRFAEIRKFSTATDLFKALDSSEIDAALVDDIAAQRNYENNDPVEFYGPALDDLLRKEGFYESLGFDKEEFAMAVSRDSGDLINTVNAVIDAAAKNGVLQSFTTTLLRSGLKKVSPRRFC